MNFWFTEMQTSDMAISCRVNKLLHYEKTSFQEIAVYDTAQFGRMLVLDDVIQTTVEDEFVYHEMITHVGLSTHFCPQRVLVIGGGDGGSIREILKHPSIEKAVLVEIDRGVIEAAKRFLPEICCCLDDSRVEVIIDDGIKHVQKNKDTYDIIVIDSTDPVGPAEGLFSASFYQDVYNALKKDGLFVAQTESPFFNKDLIKRIINNVSEIFPITRLYLACVPSYPGGLWSFTMGSKEYDPLRVDFYKLPDLKTRYYSPAIHHYAFKLPPFVTEFIER